MLVLVYNSIPETQTITFQLSSPLLAACWPSVLFYWSKVSCDAKGSAFELDFPWLSSSFTAQVFFFFFMIQDISRENVKELFLTAHTKCQGSQWISAGSPRLITPLRKPGLKEQGPHARGMAIA